MSRPPLLVQKFGGTSVSTADRRQQVVARVRQARADGRQVAVVISALGRRGDPYATDTLLDLLRGDGGSVDPRDYDLMFTCGEAIAVALLSHVFKRSGIPAVGLTSAQARIFTDGHHVESEIVRVDTARLRALLAEGQVPVITGGQGVAPDTLDYTTLGRGGSDTSAVALGAALGAERVDIFTDVSGVAVVDPRLVPGARTLTRVSYETMFELARFGAKVVHPRAILTGWHGRTPLAVRSTFTPDPGTLIGDVEDEAPIVGLAQLPPMETSALPAGSVPQAVRDEWEQRHLVMSVVDSKSGLLLVGATADKAADLRRLEAGETFSTGRRIGPACWVSVVGESGALREQLPRLTTRLAQHAVEVYGCEIGGIRCTFVLPEAARPRAVALMHDAIWTDEEPIDSSRGAPAVFAHGGDAPNASLPLGPGPGPGPASSDRREWPACVARACVGPSGARRGLPARVRRTGPHGACRRASGPRAAPGRSRRSFEGGARDPPGGRRNPRRHQSA